MNLTFNQTSDPKISLYDQFKNYQEGILVEINCNKLSIVSPKGVITKYNTGCGYISINTFGYCGCHTWSKDFEDLMNRTEPYGQNLYYFKTLKELAEAIIENGWKL